MSLRIITTAGTVRLGDPPASGLACAFFCGRPAQLVVDSPTRTLAVCTACAEDAIVVGAELAAPRA